MITKQTLNAMKEARTNIDMAAKAIGVIDEVACELGDALDKENGLKLAAAFHVLEQTINPIGNLLYQLAETAEELGAKPEH